MLTHEVGPLNQFGKLSEPLPPREDIVNLQKDGVFNFSADAFENKIDEPKLDLLSHEVTEDSEDSLKSLEDTTTSGVESPCAHESQNIFMLTRDGAPKP